MFLNARMKFRNRFVPRLRLKMVVYLLGGLPSCGCRRLPRRFPEKDRFPGAQSDRNSLRSRRRKPNRGRDRLLRLSARRRDQAQDRRFCQPFPGGYCLIASRLGGHDRRRQSAGSGAPLENPGNQDLCLQGQTNQGFAAGDPDHGQDSRGRDRGRPEGRLIETRIRRIGEGTDTASRRRVEKRSHRSAGAPDCSRERDHHRRRLCDFGDR